ncbi:bifunctional phosphopantothenoylcysteine decarboxylase/phosphopantothenate--cysteine ligase CoaBC [Lentisalinibacter sediminis]|uniref:bifunctional phosphopantothenoylcysteine decarboxylase/phosphopantothenate--cysteine ligase CoaBC n=1 Tax=Lentisalinibacter sediminis TaxID=2992237 RepID=UPI00386351B1
MKHILLGVTGGIAAYKSPEIVRRLTARGLEVQVVMTAGAQQFVTPLTFQAVSGRPVRTDLWDLEAEAAMGHIELARWADLVLVAPATADFMARLAHGQAPDLLSTLCLATEAPIVLAPAMNRLMWANDATQENRQTLLGRGIRLLGPAEGDQACGETGPGRMLEPADIVAALPFEQPGGPLSDVSILISAGPTREPLDPVRFLSNRSSGKMGFALAEAAAAAGARVRLVAGPVALDTPPWVERHDVETAEEMLGKVQELLPQTDIYVGAAAIADYQAPERSEHKIKKTGERMQLDLVRAPDTLAAVARAEGRPFTVGFAAETENLEENARGKLTGKGLDMIVANRVGGDLGFDTDENAVTVFWNGGEREFARTDKKRLARGLMALIMNRYQTMFGETQPGRITPVRKAGS